MFKIYMNMYKSIYMYAYMLCTKRFVVIFVVIVWKITLNTLEKLQRDYLRKLFEENHLKKIIWEMQREKIFDKRNETEYWESWDIKREQIDESYWLKFLVFVSSVSIFRLVFSYQIFLFAALLKWFFSNDFSQIILFK
jgi:hypothetical protein